MAVLTATKAAEIMMEVAVDTFTEQTSVLQLIKQVTVPPDVLQNTGNAVWRKVRQRSASLSGFDLSGQQQGIVSQAYQAVLGTPDNDLVELGIQDVRDESYFRDRGREAATQRATNLNANIANIIRSTGSLFYRSNATSGFNFVAQAKAAMDKRQVSKKDRYFILNDDHEFTFATDLAARQTLQGRPDETWKNGQIGKNIAGFDIYSSSSIGLLTGGATNTTVTGNQSFKPEGGSVTLSTGTVTNIDYRDAIVPVAATAAFAVGDRVNFTNGATTVKAVGLADKTVTNEAFTATVVEIISGTSVRIWPKPIAADDPALTPTEKAYANINTRILNAAVMTRVNTDASTQPSLFMQKDTIEVLSGDINLNMWTTGGQKAIAQKIKGTNITLYLLYDSDIVKASTSMRLFCWYGVNNANPSENGIAVKF